MTTTTETESQPVNLNCPSEALGNKSLSVSGGGTLPVPAWKIAIAFAVVYLVWGSTYLAIKYAVASIPPFLICGIRFIGSGLGLFVIARLQTKEQTTWTHWRNALLIGCLMFLGANGLVFWAETLIPSGVAALLIATVPLWMVGLDTTFFGATRTNVFAWLGIVAGLIGVAVLFDPFGIGSAVPDPRGIVACLFACLSWSIGSLVGRKAELPKSLLLAVAMQMLTGGAMLLLLSAGLGEWARFELAMLTRESVLALLYLIVFGGMLAFSCFTWLMRVCSASAVSTYAYVNPMIAVLLGWWIGNETLTSPMAYAGLLIVASVIVIVTLGKKR